MKAVFYTNRGRMREANEDALFVGGCAVCGADMTASSRIEIDTKREIFCAIDGMGGYRGGAVAARVTAQAFAAAAEFVDDESRAWVESVLRHASEEMREAARRSPELADMGATLAGALIDRGRKAIFAFNLGDCRVYRFRGGFLDKLTHDHSRVQELFDRGEISEEEMRAHPHKNVVTAGVVANDLSVPEFFCREFPLQDGDKFFACSDGVWEALPIDEIERSLSCDDASAGCEDLRGKLFAARCGDNVSFLFVS